MNAPTMAITPLKTAENYVEKVPKRYWETMFLLVLLGYTSHLITQALHLSGGAGLFPLMVGIPLFVLIFLQLILTTVFVGRSFEVGGLSSRITGALGDDTEGMTGAAKANHRREFTSILWVGVLLCLIWLAGFLAGVTLFVFSFIAVNERDFRRAVVVTVSLMLSIYVLFVELLSLNLAGGML